MSPTNRTQSRVSSPCPLDQRLLAYALGGGALALVAVPAEATPISSGIQNITLASPGAASGTVVTRAVNLIPGDANSPVFQLRWDYLSDNGDAVAVKTVAASGPGEFAFYTSSFSANLNFGSSGISVA